MATGKQPTRPALQPTTINNVAYVSVVNLLQHLGHLKPGTNPQPTSTEFARRIGVEPDLILPNGPGMRAMIAADKIEAFKAALDSYKTRAEQERTATLLAAQKQSLAVRKVKAAKAKAKAKAKERVKEDTTSRPIFSGLEARLAALEAKVDRLLAMWEPSVNGTHYDDATGAVSKAGDVPSSVATLV